MAATPDHRVPRATLLASEDGGLPVAPPAIGVGSGPVLEVTGLRAFHRTKPEPLVVAENVSFSLDAGKCLALVGESGSGKTTIARTIAGLHANWSGSIRVAGAELGRDARKRPREQLRQLQMVFQNPTDTLNPRVPVGSIIARSSMRLRGLSRRAAAADALELLDAVRLPARVASRFPHELSGGQRQRVAIARALAAHPEVLVCDEVTSALDVSVQAVVLDVLNELRREEGLAMLFITHDLGVVSAIADDVIVLERGLICESGPARTVLDDPREAYTRKLLAAAPSLSERVEELAA